MKVHRSVSKFMIPCEGLIDIAADTVKIGFNGTFGRDLILELA